MPIALRALRKELVGDFDLSLLKGSALVAVGMAVSRGLGFLVSLSMARLFHPDEFGVIQYSISLVGIVALMVIPFGQHVLARYIGMNRESPEKLRETQSNAWVILTGLTGLTAVLAVPVLILTGKFSPGILVMFLGQSLFYTYWGLARGFTAAGRLVIAEVGTNIVQLTLIFGLIWGMGLRSTFLALLIQGLSCLVPLALLQRFRPLPAVYDRRLVRWDAASRMLKFSLPVWLSHGSYVLCTTLPLVVLEHFADKSTVGVFSLAATLANIFYFVPVGFSTILMAKIAGSKERKHKNLVTNALSISLAGNGLLLAVYAVFGPSLIGRFFGPGYAAAPATFIIMGGAVALAGFHNIFTAFYVGTGRPQMETKSRLAALVVIVVVSRLIVPRFGALGAAWTSLIGTSCGLTVYVVSLLRSRVLTARTLPAGNGGAETP